VLGGDASVLAGQAVGAKGVVAGMIHEGKARRLAFALQAHSGLVLYEVLAADLSQPIAATGSSNPFSDLQGAIYASSTADPAALVLSDTRKLPIGGQVDREQVDVGVSHWLIVARATGPLVGTVTADAPWGALAAGVLAAILATAIVETLARRRRYALALVDQRTEALRDALARQADLERTERQAREVAEAANRSKSEFLSRMSHELRTPLNAVLGFGQLLELDELTELQQESVTQIVKGGRHLLGLINDVLDITRIETGNLAMSLEPVSAGDVVDEVLDLMRPLADARHIVLAAAQPDGLSGLHVLADHQRLKQILLNLVSNAIKYNQPGGSVIVSTQPTEPAQIRITVADTGAGIDPADLERLFVPFERLGAERSEIEGTGVGLALSRRLAEAMGGTVDVESTPGIGSRFWTQLAAAADPLHHITPTQSTGAAPKAGSGSDGTTRHKIVYIEDNPPNIRLVERILAERHDLEVVSAMQGRLGVELARQHRPALILLDLHLPDIGGDEVLRQLHADPATAAIPVVVLSADASAGQFERLLAQGATDYLTKPLDVLQLLEVVEQTVNARITTGPI
jgi:signal transduction histidine kinase/CheY-like chemotaxis protein